ncbi:MAG: glycosyl transferase 2 family protein [Candidatus Riflebacteria bacterium HGW-Riflebacteria-2]|jgi:glycosyltransferase involved in cell wall biosynthesis|nr:MAG: glycosyl transferase 2 family protein [Candidatus Riflebacteria bacterium HGW-Riflebacteria-2]
MSSTVDNKAIPLVSVAVITYNQKHYLEECINSILSQDYPNIEIVIADDASTDGTHAMLDQFCQQYPDKFVIKISPANRGITANTNLAYFACKGKYIAWTGGDDLMLPGKISKQVEFMEANPDCAICYHNLEVFDSESKQVIKLFNSFYNAHQGDIRTSIIHGTFNGACSNMVRAEMAPESGCNETLPVASDWLFWVDCLAGGGKIKYINSILGRYRRHKNNATNVSGGIARYKIDHLNACNLMLAKYPAFAREILIAYARNLFALRKQLPYFLTVWTCFRIHPDLKNMCGLFVHIITLGRMRL